MRALLAASLVSLGLTAAAHADIFKCVGPNGDVRFTSDAAHCPHAAPHAPKEGAVQRVERTEAPLASARPGASASARRAASAARDDSAAQEAAWRGKKTEAESHLKTLEAAYGQIMVATHWCNQGHGVVKENARTGLREGVPCPDIDTERARIEGELEKARSYLATGLEEECRQTGCMPGWLR